MDFYNDLITAKSRQVLQNLKNMLDFVLIGGWAVYLYTKALKSKDIDMIVNYDQLDIIRKNFAIIKNDRLKKYEARSEEVQIDIYLPYYSNLGIPVEEIIRQTKKVETFSLPSPEILLLLKQYAYKQRRLSVKGQKDKLDIISLLSKQTFNWRNYRSQLKKYNLSYLQSDLVDLLKETTKVTELGLNEHHLSRLKKKLLSEFKLSQ